MFNFLELEKEDVKKLIKVVGERDFKKAPQNILPDKRVLLKRLGKDINRLEFSKLRAYVESNLEELDDEIVEFYCKLLNKKLTEDYTYTKELQNTIGDSQYEQLTDEQKYIIAKYKEPYYAKPVLDNFENFVKFLCVSSNETINKAIENRNEEIINELKKEIEKIKKDYNQLATDYNDQLKKVKVSNNEIARLKKGNENLEKRMTFESISFNLKQLLAVEFKATSLVEVYNELTRIEQEALSVNNYELCSKTIAAKYAIVKLMKEGKK